MSNAAKYKKRAAEFESQKQFDKAIMHYNRAIAEGDAEGEEVEVAILNKVGDLTLRLGRVVEAVSSYERAIEHYSAVGLFNNAIALCNKILRHAPGRVGVYLTLGRVCARKGMRGDATRNFLEYASRMKQEGRTDEAMRSLAEVAGLMPELEEVRRMVEEHAERAGIALPTAVEVEAASETLGKKGAELVFLDVDYDDAIGLTPAIGSAAIGAAASNAMAGSTGRGAASGDDDVPSTPYNALDDLLIFDPTTFQESDDATAPVSGLETVLGTGEHMAVEAELHRDDSSETSDEREADLLGQVWQASGADQDASITSTAGLTDALGYVADADAIDASTTAPLEGLLSDDVGSSDDDALLDEPVANVVEEQIAEVVDEPVAEAEDEPVAEAEDEPVADAEDEPVADAEDEPVADAEDEPVADAEDEPVAEAADEPVVEGVDEPVALVMDEPEAEWDGATHDIFAGVVEDVVAVEVEAEELTQDMSFNVEPAVDSTEESTADDESQELAWQSADAFDVSSSADALDASSNAASTDENDDSQTVERSDDAEADGSEAPVDVDTNLPFLDITTDTESAVLLDLDAIESLGGDVDPAAPTLSFDGLLIEDRDLLDAAPELLLEPLPAIEFDPRELEEELGASGPHEAVDEYVSSDIIEIIEIDDDATELDNDVVLEFLEIEPLDDFVPEDRDSSNSQLVQAFRRLNPHDFILPGELPPIVYPDALLPALAESPTTEASPTPAAWLQPVVSELQGDDADDTDGVDDLHDLHDLHGLNDLHDLHGLDDGEHRDDDDDDDDSDAIDEIEAADDWSIDDSWERATLGDSQRTHALEAVDAPFDDGNRADREAQNVVLDRCARLREEVDAYPSDWARHRRLAEALLEAGEFESGLAALSTTILCLETDGALEEAARVTDELIRVAPDVVAHHQKRVELAVRLGDDDRLRDSYLDLADSLVRTGQAMRAEPVYVRVLELDPWDDRARAALGDAAPPPPTPSPAEPSSAADDGYVNLADWLSDDGEERDTRMRLKEPTATGDEDADFDRLLQHFRDGVARSLGEDDYESHYDLGVAYKEMGLLDDAIAEFQRALRSPTHRLPAYEALGQCFLEQRSFPVAVTVLSRALHEPGLDDEQRVGVLYLLGYACEALQRRDEARGYFERVYATDINFRDVAERLTALTGNAP